ncbi:MAG: CAP domain-containing protein [Anaerolineales bacterium]|nr:CAP domain-containing protein [Anaerolineales bacterium]
MFRRFWFLLLSVSFAVALSACSVAQSVLPSSVTAPTNEYTTYVVQPGDTASQIVARYGMTIEQLIALNKDAYPTLARDPSSLKPGWQLRVSLTGASSSPELPMTAQVDLNAVSQEVIDGINTARAQRGLFLLRNDVVLTRIANDRSGDMITRGYFSHYDPATGQEPLLRYLQATKFAYRYAGENIAEIKNDAGWVPPWLTIGSRYSTVDLANEFVKGWLNSPEHRANIFNVNYRRTGVALAISGDGRRVVATQAFAD